MANEILGEDSTSAQESGKTALSSSTTVPTTIPTQTSVTSRITTANSSKAITSVSVASKMKARTPMHGSVEKEGVVAKAGSFSSKSGKNDPMKTASMSSPHSHPSSVTEGNTRNKLKGPSITTGTTHNKNSGNDRVTVDKPRTPLVKKPNSLVQEAGSTTTGHSLHLHPTKAAVTASPSGNTSTSILPSRSLKSTGYKVATNVGTSGTASAAKQKPISSSARLPGSTASHFSNLKAAPAGSSSISLAKETFTSSSTGAQSGKSVQPGSAEPGKIIVCNPVILDEQAIMEERIKNQRLPLTDKYGSFIINSDTTLEDARSRLRTAIEQTRQLRTSFTERVYGKYRVCLKPPPSTEQILTRILSDPSGTSKKLDAEIQRLKEEKDIEKREAQKINAEITAATAAANRPAASAITSISNNDSSPSSDPSKNNIPATDNTLLTQNVGPGDKLDPNPLATINAENGEQLMFISAGLSLIVLPEQDAQGIDMSRYADRAPMHPTTGQRVKSISAAAAAAGEVMLDRARKGAAMRTERLRRRQLATAKNNPEIEQKYSRLAFLSNNAIAASFPVAATAATATKVTGSLSGSNKSGQTKASKGYIVSSGGTKQSGLASGTLSKAGTGTSSSSLSSSSGGSKRPLSKLSTASTTALPSATAKAIRARVQATMSVQTLLSLNPVTEELRNDGKSSAATLALMERGVGTNGQHNRISQQQRYRHPFPESLGGRRRALQGGGGGMITSGKQTGSSTLLHPAYLALALPPLPTAKERRSWKKLSNIISGPTRSGSTRAKQAIRKVLSQFMIAGSESQSSQPTTNARKRRKVTEIGFLHGMQKFVSSHEPAENDRSIDKMGPAKSGSMMDPMLAFHVMQAVNLVTPLAAVQPMEESAFESLFPGNLETGMFDIAESRAYGDEGATSRRSVTQLRRLHKKFSSRKRGAFSDLVLDSPNTSSETGEAMKVDSVKRYDSPEKDAKSASTSLGQDTTSLAEQTGKAPVLAIRGGGEVMNEKGGPEGKARDMAHNKNKNAKTSNLSVASLSVADPTEKSGGKGSQTSPTRSAATSRSMQSTVWNDASRQSLVLLNPGMQHGHPTPLLQRPNRANNIARARMQNPNALQLANQLRLSRLPPQVPHSGAELADYIGGLHPQASAGYDWSSIGAASAAAVASAQSLAAIGMVNFPLQDRARALLRDQQTAVSAAAAANAAAAQRQQQQALAYLSGGHAYAPNGAPHFPHMAGEILNPSAAFMAQPGIQVPLQTSQVSRRPSSKSQLSKVDKSASKITKNMGEAESKKDHVEAVGGDNGKSKSFGPWNGQKQVPPTNKKRKASEQKKSAMKPEKQARITEKIEQGSLGGSQNASREEPEKIGSKKVENAPSEGKVKKSKTDSSGVDAMLLEEGTKTSISKSGAAKEPNMEPVKKAPNMEPVKKEPNTQSAKEPNMEPAKKKPSIEERTVITAAQNSGLQFFVPPAPSDLSTNIAELILRGRNVDAIERSSLAEKPLIIGYLTAVGNAVPIPKNIVANPFKEKINAHFSGYNGASTLPQSSRDIAVASILVWLWLNHEESFQRAFAKSGRIDVEPECKWLITAAVEKASFAVFQAIDEAPLKPSSALNAAWLASRTKVPQSQKPTTETEVDRSDNTAKLDTLIMALVSKALGAGLELNLQTDRLIPDFSDLMDYLDISRRCALHSKSQERALLAALISRKATMSLPFSHAYVSSMVRAGEALGHGDLFEVVQNEDVNASTMIPYDVFTDESGAWEDPCRPIQGFNADLTGDDLMRRAHARAMIQKSLKKLQDRHSIKGGSPTPGAYIDPPGTGIAGGSDSGKTGTGSSGSSTQRGWLKRRSSFSEPPVKPGTGSATATSWSLYEPKHFSAPLEWESDDVQNGPYGRHNSLMRPRSLSLSQFNLKQTGRVRGRQSSRSMSFASLDQLKEPEPDKGPMKRSTRQIPWVNVAGIFQNVAIPTTPKNTEATTTSRGRKIFAPFVRQVNFEDLGPSDEESDQEEDLGDDIVLSRHQVVLDRMKDHLSAFLDARKKSQDRKKNRSNKNS